jgi:hypothetical protein
LRHFASHIDDCLVAFGDGIIIRPNGNVPPSVKHTGFGDPHGVERGNRERGVRIEPLTCVPRCYGDRLDLDHITAGLLALG